MQAVRMSLLGLICTSFIFVKGIKGNTGYIVGHPVKIEISSFGRSNCQNGGTQIDNYTCICPGALFGNHCNHSLYMSFDTLENVTLMQGNVQRDYDALRADGWINSAVSTNRAQRRWIDLGFHPEVCLSHKFGCGPAGGAFSLWFLLIDCPNNAGIITTRSHKRPVGVTVQCRNGGNLQYTLYLPSGAFPPGPTAIGAPYWVHMVFNFIGPNDGQGFRVYHDGQLVQNVTRKHRFRNLPTDGRIAIGRFYTDTDVRYSSVLLDELLFFNRALTEAEITRLGL